MTKRSNIQRQLFLDMLRIRIIEETMIEHYPDQEMRCPVHLSIGQEAAAVGVCASLRQSDWVLSGHRNHAHYIAKGGDIKKMLAEIYGKAAGCCGGKGGSMHLTDQVAGFIGATPIVGSAVPIALGAALTTLQQKKDRVVTIFLGDGAMETGAVHESLNFAVLKNLPILFVCENNLYSVYSPLSVRQPEHRSITQLASGHGIQVNCIDGNNVEAVHQASLNAVKKIRNGCGPMFLELSTYRWREHCGPNYDNDIGYRTPTEFQQWKKQDPIANMLQLLTDTDISKDIEKIRNEISEAFIFAKNSPFPCVTTASKHIYAPSLLNQCNNDRISCSRIIRYTEALREAQDYCLSNDPTVYLMGLGVPDPKGIFGSTLGLQEKYGCERVFDIPLSENAITGVTLGSAITGLRPILTHQRIDFALVSIEQIVNQAAKWHYMFNGQMKAPMVIRMIIGRGWGQGPQHSQSLHAWFAHIPGLKVIMPTTAYDAKGMLIAAIEDDNPVLCLEHRWLYDIKDEVPEEAYRVSLDKAKVVRSGTNITLIGVSYMTLECLRAAKVLAKFGISAEVIDLRSIRPIDTETILSSVEKTGYVLTIDHGEIRCGIAGEISAIVTENLFKKLHAAPQRLGLPDYPTPTATTLSDSYYPLAKDIVGKTLQMLNRTALHNQETNINYKLDQPNASFQGPF